MPPVCPTCNAALDPTHAPVARVRAARVVTYCSKRCADSADTGAIVVDPQATATSVVEVPGSEGAGIESDTTRASEQTPIVESAEAPERISSGLRKRVLIGSSVVMLGGALVVILPMISPTASSPASAADGATMRSVKLADGPDKATPSEPPAPPVPVTLTVGQLRTAAVAELEAQLKNGSDRYRRLAGIALARLSHADALAVLGELLQTENSDLSRIDIAYGIALGGQESGRAHLLKELDSKRRDVRIDAARRLVQLGDDAGRNALVQMLGIRSHRLGAAIVLALLGDERGLGELKKTLSDKNSTAENKMRAAVGLGRSGDASAAEALKTILSEGSYVVDAAGALAVLGDPVAVPALLRQLELTSLRVGAAESLKRIGYDVDLSGMAASLQTGNAEGRIATAEALLVLTGAGESTE